MPHRLAMVRSVAERLGTARTLREVADAVLGAANEYLGAITASLWLITDDNSALEMRYEYNAMPAAVARFARVPLETVDVPGPYVVATGDACFMSSLAERDELWPSIAGTPTKSEALAVLPMNIGGRPLGVVSFGFPQPGEFDEESRVALLAVADQCAIALDRARLHDEMTERAHGQSLLARISAIDPTGGWQEMAQHAVNVCVEEGLVDFCALYVVEGHLVRRAALACASYPHLAEELVDHFPTPLASAASNATAIRTGRAVAINPDERDVGASGSPAPGYAAVMNDVVMGPGWAFPLVDRGKTFGCMIFLAPPGATLSDEATDLARSVCDRTSSLVASATAFAEQRAALAALHAIALPADPLGVPGLELASRYVPMAGAGVVGGDWWDALSLPDGRVAIAVGDVAGHGIPAAPVMGQVRNALRIQLVNEGSPAAALDALSSFLDWTSPDAHSTAFVAVIDPVAGDVTWSSAAHLPPAVLRHHGAVDYLTSEPAAAVGVRGRRVARYEDKRTSLQPGDTVVLYTDGLVEGRERGIDEGLAALSAVLSAITPQSALEDLADRVLAQLVDRPEDDVCVIAFRMVGAEGLEPPTSAL